MIVPMTSTHIKAVVGVHLHSFEGFFPSFLGPRFLCERRGASCNVRGSGLMGVECTVSPGRFLRNTGPTTS